MGWTKKGASVKPTTMAPDFSASAGEIYVNTTDGTMYVSLGSGTWSTVDNDSSYFATQYNAGGVITSSGEAATEQGELAVAYVSSLSGLVSPDGKYVVSDDNGLTFSEEQVPGLIGESIAVGAYSDGTIFGTTSTGQFGEYDGSAWNFTATAFEELGFGNDILYRYNNSAAESKVGSGAWTATNIGGEAHGIGSYSGQHAIVSNNEIKLGDGVTFDTNIGDGGYNFDESTADNDRVVTVHGIDTATVGFSIYEGSWSEATTTITVVEGDWDRAIVQEFDGDYYMIALAATYDNGMFYKSSDGGDTWATQTIPGTGMQPFELSRKGTRLFMTLFDGDFKGYVSYTDDGVNWSTPLYVSDLIPQAIV